MICQKIRKKLAKTAAFLMAAALCFPIFTENINAAGKKLIPLGRTTGIKLFSGGAMVVGFASSEATGGASPAQRGGLAVGDVIMAVDGISVESNEELSSALSSLKRGSAVLTVRRGGDTVDITVEGLLPHENGGYRLGAWVRDSMAGIGTITFVDPATGKFGALGHGICDVDTGRLMPFDNGSTMTSTVTGAVRGQRGKPGQLTGEFDLRQDSGVLRENTGGGIFGVLTDKSLYSGLKAVETAGIDDVRCGKVEILSNISGTEVESYSAKITRIMKNEECGRDFMIEITDDRLIGRTGGIVQGMSGSPILQDGRLIGAVTHVLINDPEQGYGISIDNMMGYSSTLTLSAA